LAVARVHPTTPVTVVVTTADPVPAVSTLEVLAAQDYGGPYRVVLVDCGRGGAVAAAAAHAARDLGVELEVIPEPHGMLDPRNAALERIATPLTFSVEAGVGLHPSALRLLVARLQSAPPETAAVAAQTLIRNRDPGREAEGLAAGWLLELDAIRRTEALFAGPLAVNGSCTLFRTDALCVVNGWPGGQGGDVLLAWRFLERGGHVLHEPLAIAYTTTLVTTGTPARWRAAAARAVHAAADDAGGIRRLPHRSTRLLVRLDGAAPALDLAFTVAWVQALALGALGHLALVAAHLVLVVPVALGAAALERRRHREVLDEAGLVLVAPHEGRVAALGLQAVQGPLAVWERLRVRPRTPRIGAGGLGVTPGRRLGARARPYA
jgi:biofilm PGA synthesis N-glycosyltransferase PgaC